MALFRRRPEDRFHAKRPRTAGAIGGAIGGTLIAGILYAVANSFGSDVIGIATTLALGAAIGGAIGTVFPRLGHRSLFYAWFMALGL